MKLHEKRYSLWLSNKTYTEVKRYAEKKEWTFVQAIRYAIKKLLGK